MASSSYMADSQCPACGVALGAQRAHLGEPVRVSTCGHTFHMACICQALYNHVTRAQFLSPAGCPQCGAEVVRPPRPDVKHLLAAEPKERMRMCSERDAWHRVNNRLRKLRDSECRKFANGDVGREEPGRAALAEIRQKTNFFEMVNACWVCRKALIKEEWVTLPECKHALHMRCLMNKWWTMACNTGWAYWHGIGYPCPLCEEANVCPKSNDVNWDWTFFRQASDHLREVPVDALWYAMMVAIRWSTMKQKEDFRDTCFATPVSKRHYRQIMDDVARKAQEAEEGRNVRPRYYSDQEEEEENPPMDEDEDVGEPMDEADREEQMMNLFC